MRHHNDKAVVRNLFEKFHYLHARFTVERARRFVGEQNFGVVDKRAGNCDSLHLTARKLVGASVDLIPKPHLFKYGDRSCMPFFRSDTRQSQRKFDVFGNRLVRNQIITLKHETYRMIAVRIPFFIRKILRAFAVDYKVARRIAIEPADYVEKRGLSATRRT